LRTVDGPFNCKAVPVRRCPNNFIEGKTLRVRARSYEQGDCLDIIDRLQVCIERCRRLCLDSEEEATNRH
jgi:hypothetical protein